MATGVVYGTAQVQRRKCSRVRICAHARMITNKRGMTHERNACHASFISAVNICKQNMCHAPFISDYSRVSKCLLVSTHTIALEWYRMSTNITSALTTHMLEKVLEKRCIVCHGQRCIISIKLMLTHKSIDDTKTTCTTSMLCLMRGNEEIILKDQFSHCQPFSTSFRALFTTALTLCWQQQWIHSLAGNSFPFLFEPL